MPASQIADAVNAALSESGGAVITAPPGAGKSTLLPLTILQALTAMRLEHVGADARILMLEPRRLAARQIAERMADMLGEKVGETVGYRIRFEHKVSKATRIEVLTEGVLTRMLARDPALEGVGVVIFDEYHERSLNSDLSLALTRLSRDIIRPDLKIVIMSATIDAALICKTLSLPLIQSEGKMFPVQIHYADKDIDIHEVASTVASAIRKAHRDDEGSILVFLPGQGDIQRCADILNGTLGDTCIFPLYGNLLPEQQRLAIAPMKAGGRKVVLATPIAETSLTIEGIKIVVDSGLHRKLVFDARTGLSSLVTMRISKDMATQRSGRAGRLSDGVCYRLWTKVSESRMDEQRQPEILEADLAPAILEIAAFGESDIESLPWMTRPERDSIYRGRTLLQNLGAVDASGGITTIGRSMVSLPCHPRISRMILHASDDSQKSLACDIAALLEEKDPMSEIPDSDITLRISALRKARADRNPGRWARIARISEEYHRMANLPSALLRGSQHLVIPKAVGALLAYAYPERIAKALDSNGSFRLACGDNVRIDMSDSMSNHTWIAIASGNLTAGGFLAAPLDVADIQELTAERDNVSWDGKGLQVLMQHERRIGRLLVEVRPIHDASRQSITDIICAAVKKDGLSMFDWSEEVQRLQRRVAQTAAWHPEFCLPDVSTDHLLQTASDWLPMYLEVNGRMAMSANELRKIDLTAVVMGLLYNYQSPLLPGAEGRGDVILNRYAPSHVQMPTGSRIRIDYRIGSAAPVLSVRLQECFGMSDTPTVNDGRQPVLMELLSPGFKPVQLTQDLRSFWNGTYFEVRKELKRRYPKHYWPENPLEAEAVRGVKR